ncbi:hypothetical protein FrCorBMG51_21740 [Protofrankia coriariae]|uniref:Uncharacterized protein n=1 Tax=Protofrankia coriariae TaxID=1562887 RepID=A0ABR5EZI5_9ACTN|nr:hypothetical protein FrCorBMG51_21740 [Protofrankia coriariae]
MRKIDGWVVAVQWDLHEHDPVGQDQPGPPGRVHEQRGRVDKPPASAVTVGDDGEDAGRGEQRVPGHLVDPAAGRRNDRGDEQVGAVRSAVGRSRSGSPAGGMVAVESGSGRGRRVFLVSGWSADRAGGPGAYPPSKAEERLRGLRQIIEGMPARGVLPGAGTRHRHRVPGGWSQQEDRLARLGVEGSGPGDGRTQPGRRGPVFLLPGGWARPHRDRRVRVVAVVGRRWHRWVSLSTCACRRKKRPVFRGRSARHPPTFFKIFLAGIRVRCQRPRTKRCQHDAGSRP